MRFEGEGLTFSMAPHSIRPSLSPSAIWVTGLTSMNLGSPRNLRHFIRYAIFSSSLPDADAFLPLPASLVCRSLSNVAENTRVCLCVGSSSSSSCSES